MSNPFDENDEGPLQFRVGVESGTVIIDFGKPVCMIGLSGDEAAAFAMTLLDRAKEAGLTKPVTILL